MLKEYIHHSKKRNPQTGMLEDEDYLIYVPYDGVNDCMSTFWLIYRELELLKAMFAEAQRHEFGTIEVFPEGEAPSGFQGEGIG